ncbi:D-alanyl-D-alanine carboxypeptidase (penicillin-binding protein 5/6) [Kitasatospora sp. MAA4]|uniref:D-alanyl-D-alanine carboxypeptidase n=1 Tax=Kitasatospora sp. MAA4 TaxID=3035093 RepID=UPI0024755356|nr:D-alanyl-D-alanine carboxypeptidase [Kitasatospora sp. MAA4]MDH6134048.1 D-alanyl-D-alanine carboxypeptidase (penicillin-binding protein 5/6) [Kitasatospora sp. MAA4]
MGEAPDKARHDGERELPAEVATTTPTTPAASGGEEAGGDVGGSTVHLRVRDADNATTFLRMPDESKAEPAADRATTFLRMPADPKPATAPEAEPAEPSEADDEAPAEPQAPQEAGSPDPRLAIRDAREGAAESTEEAEAEPEPEAATERDPEPAAEPVAESPSEPEPEPELVLVAVAAVAAPEVDPAASPVPPAPPAASAAPASPPVSPWTATPPQSPPHSPLPPAPAQPESGYAPETTSEALEVLAALSARPVSPLRRALKRITIWTVFFAVVLGAVVTAQLLRPLPGPKPKMTTAGSFTFTGDPLAMPWPTKGQAAAEVVGLGSLGNSGPDTPVPIASVTKVMNAYLILQDHPLKKGETGPALTVDKAAAQESGDSDQSTAKVTEGQQISEYEALEMLMLPSANNIARLLARWDAGTEDAFVKKMNDQATAFGMADTTYADAAGYNNDTKSTAKDQLKLAEQVMKNDIFRQIVAEPDSTINGTRIYNTNALLNPKSGIIGTKTGSSTPAGSCLMWAAVKDVGGTKQMILGVTLGQPPTTTDNILKAAQTVSAKIITAGQNALTAQVIAKQGDVVGYVDDGLGGRAPVVAGQDVTVSGWTGTTATLSLDQGAVRLGHSAKAGTQVGTITAGEGTAQTRIPVLLQHDLAPPSIMSRLTRLL